MDENACIIHGAYGGDFVLTMKDDVLSHADKDSGSGKTVQEVLDGMSEKKKTVLYALVGEALNAAKKGDKQE